MPFLDLYNREKEKVSDIYLKDNVFAGRGKEHIIYDVIKMHLARKRRGTASTKTRGEVSGGGKKPWKQKGTGRARAGSSRSPLWRKGGIIFGPHPRDYSYSLPKKVRKAALGAALSIKFREGNLFVIQDLEMERVKTKDLSELLKKFDLKEVLIVDKDNNRLRLSARNIPGVKVINPEYLNVFDLIRYKALMVSNKSLSLIETLVIEGDR